MCMQMYPARYRATSCHISGRCCPALISFTTQAPRSKATCATSGFRVSMEIGTGNRPLNRRRTGTTRRSSSSTGTGSENGRVDSPPISTRSAPSSNISQARSTARSGSKNRPPSENESGVTFKTPIINIGRGNRHSYPPARQIIAASFLD